MRTRRRRIVDGNRHKSKCRFEMEVAALVNMACFGEKIEIRYAWVAAVGIGVVPYVGDRR